MKSKKGPPCPIKALVIWAMHKSKRFFTSGVFPYHNNEDDSDDNDDYDDDCDDDVDDDDKGDDKDDNDTC